MEHYQKQFTCSLCKRVLIADIMSFGTSHQNILAITCLECAERVGGKIMGEKIEIPVRRDAVSSCCGAGISFGPSFNSDPFICQYCQKSCQVKQMHDAQILKA